MTNDNIAIIVPNSAFIAERVTNWSYGNPFVRITVPVGVSYASDPEVVRRLLLEVASGHEGVIREPGPDVVFTEFGDSSLNFELRVWTREYMQRPAVLRSQLNFAIWQAFRSAAIEIPFPQRDLHIRSGTLRVTREPRPAT